jgi:LPS-assembly protein
MARFTPVLGLAIAALAWPSSAAGQLALANCELASYITAEEVKDPGRGEKASHLEFRGQDGVPIEVRCGEVQLIAQEIDYQLPEERLIARGNVVFQQAGTRIAALSGEFDAKTRTGSFEMASGTLQLTDRVDRTLFGTQEPEAIFSADRIEKTGPRTYKLTNAVFTACVQPSRRWEMTSSRMTFTVDKYAILYNAVLQVKDVPVLYVPLFYYPIHEDGRATGFLMPSYGSSTFRGFSLSNAFFWAISRSVDATLYHDWFAKTGQGFGGDFRYVAGPGATGDGRVYVIREKAQVSSTGALVTPARQSFEVRGRMSQKLPGGIRLQARANYFSDVAAQQIYQVDLYASSERLRQFGVDASGNLGRVQLVAQADRRDWFYGTTASSSMRTQPHVNAILPEALILRTPIYATVSVDAVSMVSYSDAARPETRVAVFRTDGQAAVRVPVSLGSALTINGSASVRRTSWNVSRDPVTGAYRDAPLTRDLFELRGSVTGPVFTKVYNTSGSGFAERFKHIIEPRVTIQKRSVFTGFNEVVQLDALDTILGGVTQVTYSLTNRLTARVRQAEGTTALQEVMNVDISQTYYTDALAASYDLQYQSSFGGLYSYTTPPSKFSPVRATVNFTPTATLGGDFSLEYDTQFLAVRTYRASARAASDVFDFSGTWSKRQFIPGLPGHDTPGSADQFVTLSTRGKRASGAASLGYNVSYDVGRKRLLQHRVTGFYNAQCCGVALDYAVTNLAHYGLRNDKRFSFSFTLAGIGSFTNLLGVFGDNGRQR